MRRGRVAAPVAAADAATRSTSAVSSGAAWRWASAVAPGDALQGPAQGARGRSASPAGGKACVEFPLRFQLVPCRFSSVADGIVGGEGRLTGHRPAADA